MKDEKIIEKVRLLAWELANKAMEIGEEGIGLELTTIAQTLDWVLEKEKWPIIEALEKKALKKVK